MDALLRLLLTNAAAAGLLAALAFLVSRSVRRPALAHGLWLLALLKLVTPPVVPLPLLPEWGGLIAPSSVATHASPLPSAPPLASDSQPLPQGPNPVSARHTERPSLLRPALAAVLAGGAVTVLLLGVSRFLRFRRLLARAEPAPEAILTRAGALAEALGLRRVPPVRVVAAPIPPMLWPEPTGPVLLLPRDLLGKLDAFERDALLAHELAHVRRRDHWVRLLELAATALFWWYPVTWWARAALRRAEERCCDEWVLRVLPRSAEAYAKGLLKSLTFVASAAAPVPSFASGASPLYELETRLKEILMSRPAPRLAAPIRVALLVAAGLGLAVFPTHARNDEPAVAAKPAAAAKPVAAAAPARPSAKTPAAAPAAAPATATPATDARVATPATPAPAAEAPPAAGAERRSAASEDAERALEAQRRAFEQKRLGLQRRELELQRQEIELRARAEQDEARACAEKMRADGKTSEAESCERRGELVDKRVVLEQHRIDLQAERLVLEAKQQSLELAADEHAGALGGREAQQAAIKHMAEDRRRSEDEMIKRHRAIEGRAETLEKQVRELESLQRVKVVGAASEEFARALADQIETLKASLRDNPAARIEVEREMKRLEAALAALRADRP